MFPPLSKERLHYLAKLKQKKYRLLEKLVIVEGKRTLEQLAVWGILPLELYTSSGEAQIKTKTVYQLSETAMNRICDSETPPQIAGLFQLPVETKAAFNLAFYLDGISDPGNLGTIFRTAAGLGVKQLILSPNCCELSAPKVIRASLGAVYRVPYIILPAEELPALKAKICALDMQGTKEIKDFTITSEPQILALGSEAHGLSAEVRNLVQEYYRIGLKGEMESLNAAVSFAIAAYCVSVGNKS